MKFAYFFRKQITGLLTNFVPVRAKNHFFTVLVLGLAVFGCVNGVNGQELENYLENFTLNLSEDATANLLEYETVDVLEHTVFPSEFAVADQDVWVFNSRTASWTHPGEQQLRNISVYRLNRSGENSASAWNRSTLDDFLATSSPDIPTIVLIHGNQTSFHEGIESGFHFERMVLRRKTCTAANHIIVQNGQVVQSGQITQQTQAVQTKLIANCGVRKYRFLIWCWPADKPAIKISLKDAKLKAFYSEKQAFYVAHVLRRLPSDSRVCLVGFSYGGRVICEALHYLRQNDPQTLQSLTIRNLLMAPAVDQALTAPQCRYGQAISATERTMLLYNPRDSALRWYSCIYGCGVGAQSLGREGFPGIPRNQALAYQITAFDISPLAGKKHSFMVFFRNASLNQKMTQFAFFE